MTSALYTALNVLGLLFCTLIGLILFFSILIIVIAIYITVAEKLKERKDKKKHEGQGGY